MFCCWARRVKKKSLRDWINAQLHVALPQMAHLWLSVKVVSGWTVVFGSRIINFPGGNSWQFIVKIRGGQMRESGYPSLLFGWASLSNKTLSRSGPRIKFSYIVHVLCKLLVYSPLFCSKVCQYIITDAAVWTLSDCFKLPIATLCSTDYKHLTLQHYLWSNWYWQ